MKIIKTKTSKSSFGAAIANKSAINLRSKDYTTSFQLCSGNVDTDIVFTFETDTEVHRSCSSTLNNEHYVIGGTNKKRQVKNYYV